MASSKLIIEKRDNLYRKKYEYKAELRVALASLTRNSKNLDEFKVAVEQYKKYWPKATLSLEECEFFEKYFNWIKDNKNKCALRVSFDKIIFYSNDIAFLKTLEQEFSKKLKYYQVKVSVNGDIKYLSRKPNHAHRVYLKHFTIDRQEYQDLVKLLKTHKNSLFPSIGFRRWIERHNQYLIKSPIKQKFYFFSTGFIDYDDESIMTLMGLSLPSIFSKNFKLEKETV